MNARSVSHYALDRDAGAARRRLMGAFDIFLDGCRVADPIATSAATRRRRR
jgi:hypothetical protein